MYRLARVWCCIVGRMLGRMNLCVVLVPMWCRLVSGILVGLLRMLFRARRRGTCPFVCGLRLGRWFGLSVLSLV